METNEDDTAIEGWKFRKTTPVIEGWKIRKTTSDIEGWKLRKTTPVIEGWKLRKTTLRPSSSSLSPKFSMSLKYKGLVIYFSFDDLIIYCTLTMPTIPN